MFKNDSANNIPCNGVSETLLGPLQSAVFSRIKVTQKFWAILGIIKCQNNSVFEN